MLFIEDSITSSEFTFEKVDLSAIFSGITADFFSNMPDATLSFVEPDEIRSLNKQFRHYDEVTDVLSFSSGGEIDPETTAEYLGDILICIQKAAENSMLSGHPLENEIALLFIHGMLHLLGYDHHIPEEKEEMWQLQDEYLKRYDIFLGHIPGEIFGSKT